MRTMKTRAKFVCDSRKETLYEGQPIQVDVTLTPVYSDDPEHENHAYWDATPTGHIALGISNPLAFDAFVEGAEYYVDFTKAEG
jgi:hypothetical protein